MKLSTLVEEVHSAETDELESQGTIGICKFWNSQPIKFSLRAIELDGSHFETIQVS